MPAAIASAVFNSRRLRFREPHSRLQRENHGPIGTARSHRARILLDGLTRLKGLRRKSAELARNDVVSRTSGSGFPRLVAFLLTDAAERRYNAAVLARRA